MGIASYDSKKVAAAAKTVTVLGTARKNYFDGLGKEVSSATSLDTAIAMSGLDFKVKKVPIQFITERLDIKTGETEQTAHLFPDQYATIRTDTNEPLGVVGKQYQVLQNHEAFDFLDSMTRDAKFETAGAYGATGAKSFITMSTEPMQILGDEFKPYILFMNSMDGSSSVRAMFTPIRVFCSNCLARANRAAVNKISIKHSATMKDRLEAAKLVLLQNTKYLDAIKAEAEKMAVTPYTDAQFKDLVTRLFANEPDATDIQKLRNEAIIDQLIAAYNQVDLQNFNNTVYKAVQAVADYESHLPAFREGKNLKYKNITTVINGMPLTNMVADSLMI